MPVANSYIDYFKVRNTTNHPITLGDLVNVLIPAKRNVDLLQQPRVTKEKINQSVHLQTAIRVGWLVVTKPSKKSKTKRERQATVSDEIYDEIVSLDGLSDVSISSLQDNDLLQYDSAIGEWVNQSSSATDIHLNVVTKTADYTAASGDDVILCDATNPFTVTLPTAVGVVGEVYHIKKIDSTINNVTIEANGSETIDGELTKTINTQWNSVQLVSDGSNWMIL